MPWPGLSARLISKHLPQSPFTVKVHLDQEKKNLRSTHSNQALLDNVHPKQEQCTHNIFAAIIDVNSATATLYSNQTGRLSVLSSHRNQYILVLYNYDTNSIHAHLLKNRQALEITTAWTACHKHLRQNGAAPNLHILDNKCSYTTKKSFRKYNVDFQLVPPYTHFRNAAERAIHTFKNNLCARLASCDPNLPPKNGIDSSPRP